MTTNIEHEAQNLAESTPRHAIEGWLSGYEAYGDKHNAAICRRALAIQDEWRAERRHESRVS